MSDLEERARRLIDESRQAERLAFLLEDGPPVRLRDLCSVTGFSKMKFFDAIDKGELVVRWIRTGQTRMVVVERREALRYLTDIGFAA